MLFEGHQDDASPGRGNVHGTFLGGLLSGLRPLRPLRAAGDAMLFAREEGHRVVSKGWVVSTLGFNGGKCPLAHGLE